MVNFTTNTYKMKREILTYSNKISKHLSTAERKFTADMTYGMPASGNCLLTDIADQLYKNSNPPVLSGMGLQVLHQEMFTKKGFTLRKPVC